MTTRSDISFFAKIIKYGSLARAARAMGITPPALSKRLTLLEARLKTRLLNRTTRSLSLTAEGQLYLEMGGEILAEFDQLEALLSTMSAEPRGLLGVNAPLNFGRMRVAPAISDFIARYPGLEVDLDLSDHPKSLTDEGFDLAIRLGDLPDSGLRARRIASNRRHLCASPEYLERHGTPASLADLARHECLVVRRSDVPFGVWKFVRGESVANIKVHGRMTCNDGEVALHWALNGHGIVMRSGWDIARYVRAGDLRIVLPEYLLAPRDVFAVFHNGSHLSPKVRTFVDFIADRLNDLDAMESREMLEE